MAGSPTATAWRRSVAVAFAAAVVALLFGLVVPAAGASATEEARFLQRINDERTARGLPALETHAELVDVARRWSARMAADGRISHNPELGGQVTANWQKLGENVGVGPDVETLHRAFMDSPSHRKNILDPDFRHGGMGVVIDADGTIWITQVFMRLADQPVPVPPPAPTAAPAPAPAPTPAPAPPAVNAAAPAALAPEPVAAPATARPELPERVVLVLEGLRALDAGRS